MIRNRKSLVLIATLFLAKAALCEEHKPAFLGPRFSRSEGNGATIVEILPDTAAAKAKLQVNDTIVAIHGFSRDAFVQSLFQSIEKRTKQKLDFVIVDSGQWLIDTIEKQPVGTKMTFGVNRNGKRIKITVTLSARPLLRQKNPPRVYGGTLKLAGGTYQINKYKLGHNLVISDAVGYIDGNYEQTGAGLLEFNLDKDAVLDVSGDVELAGILHVGLSNVNPKVGDTLEIIRNAKSIKGSFGKLMLPTLNEGLGWKIFYDNINAGTDFDQDGKHDVTLVVVERSSKNK